eukprot:scaffold38699_cov38-Phaeocystis_antarctica.AAC.1
MSRTAPSARPQTAKSADAESSALQISLPGSPEGTSLGLGLGLGLLPCVIKLVTLRCGLISRPRLALWPLGAP